MGFIYKITNVITNKCYIGETKKNNPELRWNEHKSKIEKGIGCPALQDAVNKYGIDKFTFKILLICFDEDRYKFEIEYINKFNSIAPNCYNLTPGGEGGGFYGKKHTTQTIKNITNTLKQKYIDNPNLINQMSERQTKIMNNLTVRNNIKNGLNHSEKWLKAKQEKRVGNVSNRKPTEEIKHKIKESLKHYNSISTNVEKRRTIMSKLKGMPVQQCDSNLRIINTFVSLSEASRQTGISRKTINNGLKDGKMHSGFMWKKSL